MNLRCWNCGNDQEVATAAEERNRIIWMLLAEASLAGTCGDIYRHNALMQAVRTIEHSEPCNSQKRSK